MFTKWKVKKEDQQVHIFLPNQMQIDLDALNLAASGEMECLIPCKYYAQKKKQLLSYSTEGMIPLKNIMGKLSKECIVRLALDAFEQLKARRICLSYLVTEPDKIYYACEKMRFIVVPILPRGTERENKLLLQMIRFWGIKGTQYERLCSQIKNSSIEQGIRILRNACKDSDANNQFQNETFSGFTAGATTLLGAEDSKAVGEEAFDGFTAGATTLLGVEDSKAVGEEAFDGFTAGATTLLGAEDSKAVGEETFDGFTAGATTLLGSSLPVQKEITAFLVRNRTGERIPFTKSVLTIGRWGGDADYQIPDASGISGHHVTLRFFDGKCYATDNASTNGTMLEGVKLPPWQETELDNGALLTLGIESFQVFWEEAK